jgi:hypothetical protein
MKWPRQTNGKFQRNAGHLIGWIVVAGAKLSPSIGYQAKRTPQVDLKRTFFSRLSPEANIILSEGRVSRSRGA